ncbi:MAG: aminopeptidase [Bacteroidales bacterium]|nr:aminopeptidase [Bacteroidales bacterium]
MKNPIFKNLLKLLFSILFIQGGIIFAQEEEETKEEGYIFTIEKQIKTTSVKDQFRSGTCWSFSAISFLETELLRLGKGEYDLSEMFTIWYSYSDKAKKYVRLHGSLNFGGGGAFSDVINVIRNYGIVPESVYSGKVIGEDGHVHGEMDLVLKNYVDGVIKNKNKKLTPVWHDGLNSLLKTYLGEAPETFTYKGKEYNPKSYATELGLNLDDYISITSYTHHPFYTKFILEVPDNWSWDKYYNIPLDDMIKVIDNAINNGYSVAWAGDISEKGFSWKKGVAIIPEKNLKEMSDAEVTKWEQLPQKEKDKKLYDFEKPGKEKVITQEIRQEAFNNYQTTDDHGIHITGIAKDQNGTKYYYVKNSWNISEDKAYKGYFYASVPFIRYKTMDIMVHKDAIPKEIAKKLGL